MAKEAKDVKYIGNKDSYTDVTLKVADVTVDHKWNSRKWINYTGADFDFASAKDVAPTNALAAAKSAQAIEELAKLIKKDGLMNRPIVRDMGDGNFRLVAGFRRWQACTDAQSGGLGWKEMPVRVKIMTDSEAIRINLEENQARKELTSPELADGVYRYAKALESEGVSRSGGKDAEAKGSLGYGTRIASEMMLSKSAVNLYLRVMENVHPQIVKTWMDPSNAASRLCTLGRLDAWGKMPPADQIVRFKNLEKTGSETIDVGPDDENEIDATGGEGEETGGRTTPVLRMVKYDLAAEAHAYFKDEIKSAKNPETKAWMIGALKALEWTMGKTKKERNGKEVIGNLGEYDPWATTAEEAAAEAAKEAEAAEKAKAKAEVEEAKAKLAAAKAKASGKAAPTVAPGQATLPGANGSGTPPAKA